jgi:hypothetical protein
LKRFSLIAFMLSATMAFGSATTLYVAQSAGTFSGGSACNGQTAVSLATANGSGFWGSGSTQAGPGTTVYLCGALTASAGAVGLNIQNSGTSGSPLIILFDTGTTFKSPNFAGSAQGSPCSSSCGGIEILNQSYVIIDGGSNGMMENTAAGSSTITCQSGSACTYHGGTVAVWVKGAHNIVRNLTIQHVYDSCGATNCSDTSGSDVTSGITVDTGEDNDLICNNSISDVSYGFSSDASGSAPTPSSTVNCQSNTIPTGISVYWNTFNDACHHIQPNGSGYIDIGFNFIGTFTNWIWPGTGNGCHTDGIILYGDSSKLVGYIHHNEFSGDLGLGSPTGEIYCTYGGGESQCYVYRNLFIGIGNDPTCCQGISFAVDSAPGAMGPYDEYNNTLSGYLYMFEKYGELTADTFDFRNNIFVTPSGGYHYQEQNGGVCTHQTINGDLYNGGRSSPWGLCGVLVGSLSTWQSDCTSGGGTLCDAKSSTTAANLSAGYVPNSGSPAITLGDNLTSLSIPTLNIGAPQTFGAGGSCGTGCLAAAATGNWDAGAYPFASASVVPPTVTTTTVTSITATSASSGGTVTSNGGASVTAEGVAYGTSPNPTSPCTGSGTATPYTTTLNSLLPSRLYYYRACATNSAGTGYGSDLSFTTLAATSCANLGHTAQGGSLGPPNYGQLCTDLNLDTLGYLPVLQTNYAADYGATGAGMCDYNSFGQKVCRLTDALTDPNYVGAIYANNNTGADQDNHIAGDHSSVIVQSNSAERTFIILYNTATNTWTGSLGSPGGWPSATGYNPYYILSRNVAYNPLNSKQVYALYVNKSTPSAILDLIDFTSCVSNGAPAATCSPTVTQITDFAQDTCGTGTKLVNQSPTQSNGFGFYPTYTTTIQIDNAGQNITWGMSNNQPAVPGSGQGAQNTGTIMLSWSIPAHGCRYYNIGGATYWGVGAQQVAGDWGPTGPVTMQYYTPWSGSNSYALNTLMQPTSNNPTHLYFKVTTAGTSGSSQPNWSSSCATTCTDSGVTWTNQGAPYCSTDGTYSDEWTLHSMFVTPSNWTEIANGAGQGACTTAELQGPYSWQSTTLNVAANTFTSGGHFSGGYSHVMQGTNSPQGQTAVASFVPTQIGPAYNTLQSSYVGISNSTYLDMHFTCNGENIYDSMPCYVTNTSYTTGHGSLNPATVGNPGYDYANNGCGLRDPMSAWSGPPFNCGNLNPFSGYGVNEVRLYPMAVPMGGTTSCTSAPCAGTQAPLRVSPNYLGANGWSFNSQNATIDSGIDNAMVTVTTDMLGTFGTIWNSQVTGCGGNTCYRPVQGGPPWQAGHVYNAGDVITSQTVAVSATVSTGTQALYCTFYTVAGGTSGTPTEPTWTNGGHTACLASVTDNGVTWVPVTSTNYGATTYAGLTNARTDVIAIFTGNPATISAPSALMIGVP